MYVLLSETGDAIFNGLTPEINPLFVRYPIWIQLRDLKKDSCLQVLLYMNPEKEIESLSEMGIDVESFEVADLKSLILAY